MKNRKCPKVVNRLMLLISTNPSLGEEIKDEKED